MITRLINVRTKEDSCEEIISQVLEPVCPSSRFLSEGGTTDKFKNEAFQNWDAPGFYFHKKLKKMSRLLKTGHFKRDIDRVYEVLLIVHPTDLVFLVEISLPPVNSSMAIDKCLRVTSSVPFALSSIAP